ncbi:MAG: acyltransferase [Candidatus Eremiobacteraeota bacterium]|nr:acyltransferase [Candidatus Eremiobacteraeota bacterium]
MSAPIQVAGRTYYPHVEGLRGVAALYVFVFHIWQTAIQHPATGTLTAWLAATPFLQYGHFAVAAFIVISGYCLALPVAQRGPGSFDAKQFFIRRAWRLMPAYVPVVLLSVIPFCAVALLTGTRINLPHIGIAVALHLALIHNLFFATTEYLNGPLWSIALECQIYVVFALLLIPVWRRFGIAAQLAVALVLGFVPHFAFQHVSRAFDWTVPWLLGLFAMGVVAAAICARPALPRLPWNALTALAAVVAVIAIVPFRDGVTLDFWLWPGDLALGATLALFFVAAHRNARILPARLLSARPVVFLGTFSYSLYLIHAPLVDLVGVLLKRAHAGPLESVLVWLLVVLAVVALAYGFYRLFERPFMTPSFRRAMQRRLRKNNGADPAPETVSELVAQPAT